LDLRLVFCLDAQFEFESAEIEFQSHRRSLPTHKETI
jgi:hypothetical protein